FTVKEVNTGNSVNGNKATKDLTLDPGSYEVSIKYLSAPGASESISVSIEAPEGKVFISEDGKHLYGMKDVLLGTRFAGLEVSPDGKYMIVDYTTTFEGGRTSTVTKLIEISTGKVLKEGSERISWMPVSNKYYFTERTAAGSKLVAVDPSTGEKSVLCADLPQGSFRFGPTEDFLLFSMSQEGPKEREEIYQIITPDDRQPGWRNRRYSSKYDLKTGVMQQLTYGFHNSYINDISNDGQFALLSVSKERLEKRPTTVSTLYLLNLKTLEAEVLVAEDGFMGSGQFSPDGKQILLTGSPEAFDGVGLNVKPGQTPNTYDMQLYIMDLSTKKIRPMTKDFNPNVQSVEWNKTDGQIYFNAENKDLFSLYKMNPKNGKIEQIKTEEDLVNNFSVALNGSVLAYYGQGASNSDRLYTIDLKSKKTTLKEDLSAEILKDVIIGECHQWDFKNSKGETVYGRYYLPPHFDPSKKYPMIVNYYGGCSPTERTFESRYPHNAYASLGYIVYVVAVPSGATGNGQEWAARHVNTAGQGPAEDIIEGTKKFCEEHSFVNSKKVGIIGASYGGFMSQYIPTLTDFFACSISHAGISDHTSYWGFGYWGYSYSETSMANSYPWANKDLFVDQSPLYRADKINTPILFVHGDADTNVPFNESVQMFTALKLLGKETAFVAVKDQNHHILDYNKRIQWQNTIWAWFAKYLQDDPTWWDAIYSPKSL
ncbi:MAG: prolyl oligopeptidase family serine peptidase, partial [Bacteroidales bacterium]|nr:prolyl oligopeptidase family serine peptidase [Bacteroidales bacterium]